MIKICNNLQDLPSPQKTKRLYLDLETTPHLAKNKHESLEGAFYPFLGDRTCGIALTFDDCQDSWYVPVRHTAPGSTNLPLENVYQWLQQVFDGTDEWCNHNVKFDARFMHVEGLRVPRRLVDTVVLAKMLDSDRMTHSLKPLAADWLQMPPAERDEVAAYLKSIKRKGEEDDYAAVPVDLLGKYACGDVIRTRLLRYFCDKKFDAEMLPLRETEIKLTRVLFDMECRGMRVDRRRLLEQKRRCLQDIVKVEDELASMMGVVVVDSDTCMYDIVVNRLGLPVLDYTDKGAPSFDADVMKGYLNLPEVIYDEKKKRVIEACVRYRNRTHYNGLFINSFLKFISPIDGRVHPDYQQLVRTGRSACRAPNLQQQNTESKTLIVPEEGNAIGCADADQVEFRTIVHYCDMKDAIEAYKRDKRTDFHQYVAGICHMQRKPGKTMNFATAFGAGKKKSQVMFATNDDIVKEVQQSMDADGVPFDERQTEFAKRVRTLAENAWNRYHSEFPEIRATSERARRVCAARGYIRDVYHGRRHLPERVAHKAFNALNQGCAARIVKHRMVAWDENRIGGAVDEKLADFKKSGVELIGLVHDELIVEGPAELVESEDFKSKFNELLEDVEPLFKVPFTWSIGTSRVNWKEAKK